MIMKIESYFSGIKAANETVEALKKVGLNDAIADINDHYIGNDNPGNNMSGTASSTNSLANLVLNNDNPLGNPSLRPMAAASPMASGYGRFEEIADANYKVIVNTDSKNEEKVKQIITKMGGDLNDPNFKMPKGLENISLDDLVSIMINEVNRGTD
jgi:hypothetical protein